MNEGGHDAEASIDDDAADKSGHDEILSLRVIRGNCRNLALILGAS